MTAAFHSLGQALVQLWQPSEEMQHLLAKQQGFVDSLKRPLLAVHVRAGAATQSMDI